MLEDHIEPRRGKGQEEQCMIQEDAHQNASALDIVRPCFLRRLLHSSGLLMLISTDRDQAGTCGRPLRDRTPASRNH
jgi:hypothetical protein